MTLEHILALKLLERHLFRPNAVLDPSQVTDRRHPVKLVPLHPHPLFSFPRTPAKDHHLYQAAYHMQDYMRGHAGSAQILYPRR